jgi:hypothetical protein
MLCCRALPSFTLEVGDENIDAPQQHSTSHSEQHHYQQEEGQQHGLLTPTTSQGSWQCLRLDTAATYDPAIRLPQGHRYLEPFELALPSGPTSVRDMALCITTVHITLT